MSTKKNNTSININTENKKSSNTNELDITSNTTSKKDRSGISNHSPSLYNKNFHAEKTRRIKEIEELQNKVMLKVFNY